MNYRIADRAKVLSPSLTLAIDSKAKAMKAEGIDVVGFGAGEPDFDTPQHIKDACAAALAAGFTKYTPAAGIPELRQAIADKHKRENGLTYKPSQIIVSCGGKHSCYNVILATCQEGDEVIIPAPYWLSYPEMVKLANAKPVIIETTDKSDFKVTPAQLRAAITPNTRLFILNSPSNPTGSVYTPDEIKALGDICVEKGVLIMSDEIYEHLTYDGAVVKSVASFSPAHFEHTIIVHGFAKAWSMTGWRLGWTAAPEPIAAALGDRVYGCDICQEVCPWNHKFSRPLTDMALRPADDRVRPDPAELLALDAPAWRARFGKSAITRTKRRGLARNAAVVLGNRGDASALAALEQAAAHDPEPVVREHAAWAIERIRTRHHTA